MERAGCCAGDSLNGSFSASLEILDQAGSGLSAENADRPRPGPSPAPLAGERVDPSAGGHFWGWLHAASRRADEASCGSGRATSCQPGGVRRPGAGRTAGEEPLDQVASGACVAGERTGDGPAGGAGRSRLDQAGLRPDGEMVGIIGVVRDPVPERRHGAWRPGPREAARGVAAAGFTRDRRAARTAAASAGDVSGRGSACRCSWPARGLAAWLATGSRSRAGAGLSLITPRVIGRFADPAAHQAGAARSARGDARPAVAAGRLADPFSAWCSCSAERKPGRCRRLPGVSALGA